MSRTGRKPVEILSGAKVSYESGCLSTTGPKGKLNIAPPEGIVLRLDDGKIFVDANEDTKEQTAIRGTIRQLINNNIIGVVEGYKRVLILEGVGYRARVEGKKLILSLGFSHPIGYSLPFDIIASVDNNTKIVLEGCDKQKIGQVAAEIRAFRPPEPYKGKGVRYENEVIRRKAGKTAKK